MYSYITVWLGSLCAQTAPLDFAINRFFTKLLNTNNIEIVKGHNFWNILL